MKYIKGLDTLRAFAVILVVLDHWGAWFDDKVEPGKFIKCFFIPGSAFGVNLFFVLSGFLITAILLKAKEEQVVSPLATIKNFYARRSLRIFPIYYILLLLLYVINYPDIHQYFWYFATYTSNILCYNTNSYNAYSHTWTLSVEEQFYLIWPWLIIFVRNKYIKYVLFAAIFIGLATPWIDMDQHYMIGPLLVYHSFDSFAIGGLFAWALCDEAVTRKFITIIKILTVPALYIYFYWRYLSYNGTWFQQIYLIKTCYSIIAIWLIILVTTNKSRFADKYLLGNRALNYIGRISYGIYLIHLPYMVFFKDKINYTLSWMLNRHPTLTKIVQDPMVNYGMHIVIMLTIATLSFKFIETPILRLKKYFKYNQDNKTVTAPAP